MWNILLLCEIYYYYVKYTTTKVIYDRWRIISDKIYQIPTVIISLYSSGEHSLRNSHRIPQSGYLFPGDELHSPFRVWSASYHRYSYNTYCFVNMWTVLSNVGRFVCIMFLYLFEYPKKKLWHNDNTWGIAEFLVRHKQNMHTNLHKMHIHCVYIHSVYIHVHCAVTVYNNLII